eukprot:12962510-Alexandrium_andersonii.AAC.1
MVPSPTRSRSSFCALTGATEGSTEGSFCAVTMVNSAGGSFSWPSGSRKGSFCTVSKVDS